MMMIFNGLILPSATTAKFKRFTNETKTLLLSPFAMPAGCCQKICINSEQQFSPHFPFLPSWPTAGCNLFHQPVVVSLAFMKELWVDVFCYVHTLIPHYDAYHNAQPSSAEFKVTYTVIEL